MELTGLHHVTAVTRQAAANVEFYTQALGLRLVKKTVNQDDVSAYHLFYGDALGHAGTEMTFFDWAHAAPNRSGGGAISATAFRVASAEALSWWAARFETLGVAHGEITEVAGRATLRFADPEGQVLRLVSDGGAPGGTPWKQSPVPAAHGIKGLDGVTLTVRQLEPTASAGRARKFMWRRVPDWPPCAPVRAACIMSRSVYRTATSSWCGTKRLSGRACTLRG